MRERRRRLKEQGMRARMFEASDDLMGEVEWVAERRNQTVRETILEALRRLIEIERQREQAEWRRRYPPGQAY
ncbi:MAG: hypothetical protein M3N32_07945 [Actinomycetota bacterium]|nr:hypothetical protein [Actinomycetota bacterium]